jgi:hypothetical protein
MFLGMWPMHVFNGTPDVLITSFSGPNCGRRFCLRIALHFECAIRELA